MAKIKLPKLKCGDTIWLANTVWRWMSVDKDEFDHIAIHKATITHVYPHFNDNGRKTGTYSYDYEYRDENNGDTSGFTEMDPEEQNAYYTYEDALYDKEHWYETHGGWHDSRVMSVVTHKQKQLEKLQREKDVEDFKKSLSQEQLDTFNKLYK